MRTDEVPGFNIVNDRDLSLAISSDRQLLMQAPSVIPSDGEDSFGYAHQLRFFVVTPAACLLGMTAHG